MTPPPQSALDVAEYFLWLSANEQPDDPDYLTPLKLQKLLYFAQGWALVEWDAPLFGEPIDATPHGPVVAEVAARYPGNQPIVPGGRAGLPAEAAGVVRSVWNYYKRFSAFETRRLVMSDPPLMEATATAGQGGPARITNAAMKNAFQDRLDVANRRLAGRAAALQRLAERNADLMRRRSAG